MIKNVRHWIDAILRYPDAWIIFVCDDALVKERIINELDIPANCSFIGSDRSNVEISDIVANTCAKRWENVGYAHLTTFFHTIAMEENNFWNIDADDTWFCMEADKITEMFYAVEERAKRKRVDCMSLDFYYTATFSDAWSFGVTYVHNASGLIYAMSSAIRSLSWKDVYESEKVPTVDIFVRFLKNYDKNVKIAAFYVDNAVFIHQSEELLFDPVVHGIYCWTEGLLIRPIYYSIFGARGQSVYFISDAIEKICVGTTVAEGEKLLRESTRLETPVHIGDLMMTEFLGADAINLMQYLFDHNIPRNERIIIFGTGAYLRANWLVLKSVFANIMAFSDNDSSKWNTKIVNNLICVPPNNLTDDGNTRIIVAIPDIEVWEDINKQLKSYGLYNVYWLREMLSK